MLSSIILLAGWSFTSSLIAGLSNKPSNRIQQAENWATSFIVAVAGLYLLYLVQVNIFPNLLANKIVVSIEVFIGLTYLLKKGLRGELHQELSAPFRNESKFVKFTCITAFSTLIIFGLLTSSPLNWDSNAYNIARIATMLSDSSTFLSPETASGRQAIYSLGHDLLFYPDISWGILRGLPLICTLEFIVMTGVLLQIRDEIAKSIKIQINNQATSIITLVLLLGSHQQIMQAVITKNDLMITLVFTASLLCGTRILTENINCTREFSMSLAPQVLYLTVATSMKSYGVILALPIFITYLIGMTQGKGKLILASTIKRKASQVLLCLAIVLVTVTYIQTSTLEKNWAEYSERITPITSAWTNNDGSSGEKIRNFAINMQRTAFQGIMFPYTTLKPYLPIGPELKSNIPSSFIPQHLTGSQGSATGDFMLLYGTNPDMAYPLLITQWGIILGTISALFNRQIRGNKTSQLILFSTTGCYLLFSWALMYQHFISRFLGPVYIPLIPLASVSLILTVGQLSKSQSTEVSKRIKYLAFVASILPLLSSISLTGYLSRRAGMPQGKASFYEQYLWDQMGLSKAAAKQLVYNLRDGNFKQRTLCSEDGPWTLTPMVLSQTNSSYKSNVRLISTKACNKMLKEMGYSAIDNQVLYRNIDGHEFIRLP